MGLFDAFRKKSAPKNEHPSDFYDTAKSLGGVHEIIAVFWGKENVRTVVDGCKETINSLISEEGVCRKTELMQYGLDLCTELLENAKKNPKTSLGANCMTAFIYYRLFFEAVLAIDGDIATILELYTIFQVTTKTVNPQSHPYIQTMIKIYDLLDRGIIYLSENMDSVTEDYFAMVAKRISKFLDAYIDDDTDWNKITR